MLTEVLSGEGFRVKLCSTENYEGLEQPGWPLFVDIVFIDFVVILFAGPDETARKHADLGLSCPRMW